MTLIDRILGVAPMIVIVASCAKGQAAGSSDGGFTVDADASCGDHCDQDNDGVFDGSDQCPDTPAGAMVNHVGCADSQLTSTLEPDFPPLSLTWTPSGELGRAGGLSWRYTAIQRKDLFHIDWIICDDPAEACGLSLDGPIDVAAEGWQYSAADSDLPNGKLVFTNTMQILLEDMTSPQRNGRLTVTIVDGADAPIPFADVATLGITTARTGMYGAEIPGTSFHVVALAEVEDPAATWTPYQDYYDAAPTPVAGGGAYVSFGGSFYDK